MFDLQFISILLVYKQTNISGENNGTDRSEIKTQKFCDNDLITWLKMKLIEHTNQRFKCAELRLGSSLLQVTRISNNGSI